MDRIYLIDLKNDIIGHYHIMRSLATLNNTVEIDTCEKKIRFKKNPLKFIFERISLVKRTMKVVNYSVDNERFIAHYLTADKFYFLFWLFPGILKGKKVIATIHHIPKNKALQYALRKFSHKISGIVVLSNYLKIELNKLKITHVIAIQHPSFYDYSNISTKSELKVKFNIDAKLKVISFLGGTRYEKGLDILLDAFKYIPEAEKQNLLLNIAGAENDFSLDFIRNKAVLYNIKIRCDIKRLTDEEFMENVMVSDYIAIPYRASFNAMSGPLSEAMCRGIGCILPKRGIFEYYGNNQPKQLMFDSESSESLSKSIVYALHLYCVPNQEFVHQFQLSTFLRKSEELYLSLLKNED